MPEQDYVTNAYEVRNAKDQKEKARVLRTKKAKRTAAQKKLDHWIEANGYTAHDMWSWLSRYGYYAGRGQTKEERTAHCKRAQAIGQAKMRYCQHDKKAPKLRASGKNAGNWCCPSCNQPVGADVIATWETKKHEEDLVL